MNITRISVGSPDNYAPSLFFNPSLSPDGWFADGQSVVFSSQTNNFVPRDTNNTLNLFVSDTSKMSDVKHPITDTLYSYRASPLPSIKKIPNFSIMGDVSSSSSISYYPRFEFTNVIEGLPGDDTLIGSNDGDLINGEGGNDILIGLRGNDVFSGGDGSDIMIGGKGEDRFLDDYGNDILVGGAGSDEFFVGVGGGIDTILDFTNSEDILSAAYLTFEQLSISPGSNGTLIRVASSGQFIASLTGVTPNLIGPEDFISYVPPNVIPSDINIIEGLSSNDSLIGTSNYDFIDGFPGDDILIGLQGNDELVGNSGNDILSGGKGSDRLQGDGGNNLLIGGADNDRFSIGLSMGITTILDFTKNQDILSLTDLIFDQILISPITNGTLITRASNGEVLATLVGVAPNLIGPEVFINPYGISYPIP